MKLTKVIALPILLCMQFVTVSEVVRAGENDDLQSFCSKFPLNSKCEGYEATTTSTISLDNRSGQKAKCLFSGEEKGKKCKIDLTSDQVKVYFEIGKGLDVLDGDKKSKMSVSGESSEKRQKLDKIDLNSEEAKALLNRKSVNAHLIKKVEYFKI